MKKPRKFLIFFLFFIAVCIAVAVIFHEVVVYTSNGYIRANWAAVSPRVKGHVKAVHVKNNQLVNKGDLLIELEEYPYQLVLNVHKATLAQDQAQLKVTEIKYEMARQTLKSVEAEFKLAVKKRDRFKELAREKAVSRQAYENVETELDNVTTEFWVEANYKECHCGKIKPGQKVWIQCDLYRSRIFEGRVVSIGTGVSRSDKPQGALPYISPTIDWIRLQYRFPVRIRFLDPPPDIQFRMGADVRTLILLDSGKKDAP